MQERVRKEEGQTKKFPLKRLRERTCEAVAIGAYGRKFARGDVDKRNPLVEDIRIAGIGKSIDICIRNATGAALRHGRETGNTDRVIKAFFWKIDPGNEEELPFFEDGEKIAERVSSIVKDNADATGTLFVSQLIEIFRETGDQEVVMPVLDTFESLAKISDDIAFEFLRMAVIITHRDPESPKLFSELMGIDGVITCFKGFKGKRIITKIEKEGEVEESEMELNYWFMKSISNLAFNTKDRVSVADTALAAIVVYGSLGSEALYGFLDTLALVSTSGSPYCAVTAAAISYKLANERKSDELYEFFDGIKKMKEVAEDADEAVIGITSLCKKIHEGMDYGDRPADETGEELGKRGGTFERISSISLDEETVQRLNEEAENGEMTLEFDEKEITYPEPDITEEELPVIAKELRKRAAELMGDVVADIFAEKVRNELENGAELDEFYSQYRKIFDEIEAAGREFDDEELKKIYFELAGEMFIGMKNELLFAPFAYKVLAEWVGVDTMTADGFVSKIKPIRENEALGGICRNNRP